MLAARAWGEQSAVGFTLLGTTPSPSRTGLENQHPSSLLLQQDVGVVLLPPCPPPILGGCGLQCLNEVPLGLNISCPQGYPAHSLPFPLTSHSSARVLWGDFPQPPHIGIPASVFASEGTQPERHNRAGKCLRMQSAQRRHRGERESERHILDGPTFGIWIQLCLKVALPSDLP